MDTINPFSDPEFKKQILESSLGKDVSPDNYEIIEDNSDTSKQDLKSMISGAPKLPRSAKNIILDASAIAKNEKEQKVKEMELALNQVLTSYNKEYGLSLNLNLSDLSKSLIDVSDPKRRRILELYVSELYSSVRPLLYLHLIQKLYVAMDYILDPERLLGSQDLTTADMFLVVEKLMSYIEQISQLQDEVTIKGADLELKKIADENKDIDFNSSESKETIDNFMKLFNRESGIQ